MAIKDEDRDTESREDVAVAQVLRQVKSLCLDSAEKQRAAREQYLFREQMNTKARMSNQNKRGTKAFLKRERQDATS